MKIALSKTFAAATMVAVMFAPTAAFAQHRTGVNEEIRHRQQKKDEWKNLAIASGVIGLLGLLSKDGTVTFVGTAGALYSAYRYEQDRKSENRLARARASMFSKPYFVRNGVRYDRRVVYKGGKKYYQFVRHDKRRDG